MSSLLPGSRKLTAAGSRLRATIIKWALPLLLGATACTEVATTIAAPGDPVAATLLPSTSTLALSPGEEQALTLAARDADGHSVSHAVSWAVSDTRIVEIRARAGGAVTVTGRAAGQTTITATMDAATVSIVATVRVPNAEPLAATVVASESKLVMMPYLFRSVSAKGLTASGVVVSRPARWSSSDSSVLRFYQQADGAMGILAVRAGVAIVTASVDTASTTISITVASESEAQPVPAVELTGFTMIEYEYAGQWYYAPQLRVRETAGVSGTAIIGMDIIMPGLGNIPRIGICRPLQPSLAFDLFHELYGDYELVVFGPGRRDTVGTATAILYFIDSAGTVGSGTATTHITSGGLPTTYTGGRNPNNC